LKKYFDIKETPFGYDEAATYRALCLFSGIMHLIFHYIYKISIEDAVDPFWQRMLVGFVPLIVLFIESKIEWVKKHFILLCMIMIHANNFWFIYLMYINNFMPEYYTGYFIVVMAIGFTFSRLMQLFWFVLSTSFYLAFAFYFSESMQISAFPAFSILAAIFLLAWILLYLKITFNNRLNEKNAQLEIKNKEITDSINYAKRIQDAILPSPNQLNKYLKNGFVLYLPKDIVAGDFYWMETISLIANDERVKQSINNGKIASSESLRSQNCNDVVFFAAADCTGHGVPGAMVSVVCSNALSKVVTEEGISEPGKILDRTREIVVSSFDRNGEDVKDGMDISFCKLDLDNLKLQWAGANNPLWIIRPSENITNEIKRSVDNSSDFEFIEIRGNIQPIGKTDNPKPFTTHSLELKKGDTIYLITDGYADQFGGEKGKKLKTTNLKKLLLGMQHTSMNQQKERLIDAFNTWKKDFEQVDDVCIIGVRV
jgi:serine phosphatase RsbU (regulator of sigma subunit)